MFVVKIYGPFLYKKIYIFYIFILSSVLLSLLFVEVVFKECVHLHCFQLISSIESAWEIQFQGNENWIEKEEKITL